MGAQNYGENAWWRRLSRRRALAGGLSGAAAFAALAAGCSTSKSSKPASSASTNNTSGASGVAASAATPQPKKGGTLIDARFQVIVGRTMDPHIETPTSNKSRRQWYQGLLDYNVITLDLVPELAQKWEQPDQNTFVFHLQPGVKWHTKAPANGRALVADDVVFSLNRARTNDPKFVSRSLLDTVDQITAPDQTTVKMTTKQPDAVLLDKFASDALFMMNPETVAKAQKFATADEVVGTGAFVMKTLQDQVGCDSVRNPDYWKTGLPYLDAYSYKYFGDQQQAYAALLAKQVDVMQLVAEQIKDFIGRQPKGYQPNPAKAVVMGVSWQMPNMKKAPFSDARVALAMRLLADYQELRDQHGRAFFPNAEYGSVLSNALDKWDLTLDEYGKLIFFQQPKDAAVKQGMDMLSAAGYSKDKPLSFEMTVHINEGDQLPAPLAELIQAQWKKFSGGAVDAQIKVVNGPQSTAQRVNGTFTYTLDNDAGAIDDPDAFFEIIRTGGSRNYTSFSDPEIDALVAKQRVTFDPTQRIAVVKQAVQLLAQRSPTVVPYRTFYLNGTTARMHNYLQEGGVTMGQEYESIWVDA